MPSSPGKKSTAKRTARLPETAFQRLRQAILIGELREGDRVKETKLARDWNLGITPMREAVRRMAELGYLILRPNQTPLVRRLSVDDIRHIYELRELLECFALRSSWKAIRRQDLAPLKKLVARIEATSPTKARLRAQFELDSRLHQLWVAGCRNIWLTSALERLLIYRPNIMNLVAAHRQFADQAFDEHKRILAAIDGGRSAQAGRLLAQHIRQSGAVLVALTEDRAQPV